MEGIEDTTRVERDETGLGFLSVILPVRTTYMYIGPVSGKDVSEPSPPIKGRPRQRHTEPLDLPTKQDRELLSLQTLGLMTERKWRRVPRSKYVP